MTSIRKALLFGFLVRFLPFIVAVVISGVAFERRGYPALSDR